MANGDGCDSCDCEAVEDLTAASSGQYTCEPGTNTILYDEDLDGNADESWERTAGTMTTTEDDEDDDDDCTPGYGVAECLDDGTLMHNDECDSCDCEMDDLTANSGGQYTWTTFYIDEDLDATSITRGSSATAGTMTARRTTATRTTTGPTTTTTTAPRALR